MHKVAQTPTPPYYAVIFTSLRSPVDSGYQEMAARMVAAAETQPGFLGIESARDELGITVLPIPSIRVIPCASEPATFPQPALSPRFTPAARTAWEASASV